MCAAATDYEAFLFVWSMFSIAETHVEVNSFGCVLNELGDVRSVAHRREQAVLGNFLHSKSLSSTGSSRPVRPWLNRNETHAYHSKE
jgi:hypothetical protein